MAVGELGAGDLAAGFVGVNGDLLQCGGEVAAHGDAGGAASWVVLVAGDKAVGGGLGEHAACAVEGAC